MGTTLLTTPADVQQFGGLAGKNVPPKHGACMYGSSRARTWVHVCGRDIPRAALPALSLLAAGQGIALGGFHALPSSPRCSSKSHTGMIWRARTCHLHCPPRKVATSDGACVQCFMDTASAANYLPSTPAKDLHASDYRQAMLKTQSDASAVAANLPKICSGNCLHRGRNKVWIFEYANIICRQEHVMDVSHIA